MALGLGLDHQHASLRAEVLRLVDAVLLCSGARDVVHLLQLCIASANEEHKAVLKAEADERRAAHDAEKAAVEAERRAAPAPS